jgi:hypothetical protein
VNKTIAVLVLLTLGVAVGQSLPRPRFEVVYKQDPIMVGDYQAVLTVIHDKESGQEVVCATGTSTNARSCWPTGRNWK